MSSIVADAIQRASQAPTLAEQIPTFIRVALRGRTATRPWRRFGAGRHGRRHLPGGDCQAATEVEQFVRDAVASAVRRGEVDAAADGLADMLMGLVWGAAFQIGRGNSERADRMLKQLCGMFDQGLVR